MILLDSDHLTVLRYPENARFVTLSARMTAVTNDTFGVTVVTLEEQMRGWLAAINRCRNVEDQIPAYQRLLKYVEFIWDWPIVLLDVEAARRFRQLRSERIRISTMDLKIAAIALAQDALLLSANLRDFRQVPDLRVESWIDG